MIIQIIKRLRLALKNKIEEKRRRGLAGSRDFCNFKQKRRFNFNLALCVIFVKFCKNKYPDKRPNTTGNAKIEEQRRQCYAVLYGPPNYLNAQRIKYFKYS